MVPALRETLSRVATRVVGSRFAKPIARVVLAAAGLLLLAFVGKTAVAGAMASSAATPVASSPASAMPPLPAPTPPAVPAVIALPAAVPPGQAPSSHTQATADDPVILNTATADDLRRLPGVGEKRATAIVALRTRLGGRFRAVEDLLKVKGIGRATLRRLRHLVRLDPPAQPADGGADPPG
jgi:competence protein ComEA